MQIQFLLQITVQCHVCPDSSVWVSDLSLTLFSIKQDCNNLSAVFDILHTYFYTVTKRKKMQI